MYCARNVRTTFPIALNAKRSFFMKNVHEDALYIRILMTIALTLIDPAKCPAVLGADGQDASSGNEKYS
jgi:hypothetical protein